MVVLALHVLQPSGAEAGVAAPQAAAVEQRDPAGELSKARELIAAGSLEEAVSLLRRLVQRRPRDADAQLLLGTALALLPRRSEALEALNEAVRLRPDFAPGHNALGMALSRFVELEAARQAFERAIALDPQFAQAHVNLALVLVQLERSDDAEHHLERAIDIAGNAPDAAYPEYLKGLIYTERDQPERAAGAFERAVARRPGYADAFLQLGLARRHMLDFEGSLRALQRAVDLSPDNAVARYELGKELLRAGRPDPAITHLRHAVRAEPEDTAALYSLARALRRAERPSEAVGIESKLRAIRRKSVQARQHMFEATALNNEGIKLEQSGDVEAAIGKYAGALELDPLNTVFRRNLALALCRVERWEEGAEELKEVLRLDPDDDDATKALYIALEELERH